MHTITNLKMNQFYIKLIYLRGNIKYQMKIQNNNYFNICDPPREKVPPRGFITIIYDVTWNLNLMIT